MFRWQCEICGKQFEDENSFVLGNEIKNHECYSREEVLKVLKKARDEE